VAIGLRQETEHCCDRPRQDACLFSRQGGNNLTPPGKRMRRIAETICELVQPFGEHPRAAGRLHSVAKRHLVEREEQVRAGLQPHGAGRRLGKLPLPQQRPVFLLPERDVPLLVCLPLVIALPVE
jgi:hypothetical protein